MYSKRHADRLKAQRYRELADKLTPYIGAAAILGMLLLVRS